MNYLVSALVFAGIVWWFGLGPGRKAGDKLSPLTKKLIGAVAGGAAIILALRGRFDFAILLGSLAAWLLGVRLPALIDPIGRARHSEIRTRALKLSIDMQDGTMEAEITAGNFAGRSLSSIKPKEMVRFARELALIDPQGLSFVAQDLDRRAPGWRQYVEFDFETRNGAPANPGEMREQEAHEILGLEAGASESEIRAAHRALIGKIHPDRGGSTHLAALVNRAKDVALAALAARR